MVPISAMANTTFGIDNSKLSVILVGIGSAALVITLYHCLAMGWCRPGGHRRGIQSPRAQQRQQSLRHDHDMLELSSVENSTAQLIPAYKYQKGLGLVDDDGMCSICLSQFEEGEELRTLPECLHSYHAPCIDMWLYSHSSCPMCRTDTLTPSPSPQIFHPHRPDSSSGLPDSGRVEVVRTIIVQSGT